MIFNLTEQEQKELQALEDSYSKLLRDSERKIEKLRPDDPEPYSEEYEQLQASRPSPPVDTTNEVEYEKYLEENKRINDAVGKLYDEWYAAGSDEWKAEMKRTQKLQLELIEARRDFMKKAEDRYFLKFNGDSKLILEDAKQQVEQLIFNTYDYYVELRKEGSFSASDVRLLKDGSIRLDRDQIRKRLANALDRHFQELPFEMEAELVSHIEKILSVHNFISKDGDLGAMVPMNETTERKTALAKRPDKYVTPVDRVTSKLFKNELMKPEKAIDGALYDVPLDDQKTIFARAMFDYHELLQRGIIKEMPNLSEKERNVHDAIISLLYAGNIVMSYDMIYRAMTGKIKGKVTVPDDMMIFIDQTLDIFRGTFILEYEYLDENGKPKALSIDEPLVTFQRLKERETSINGKLIRAGIKLSQDPDFYPPLYRWSQFNGKEIDTRDITLLDVPHLNNGDESFIIKMCLYRRIIKMRNKFEREKKEKFELYLNQRTIRYDYVYEALHDALKDKKTGKSIYQTPNANKRRLLKDKIDRCMKHWESKGLISGYEHKRDKTGAFYAVVVTFMPKE